MFLKAMISLRLLLFLTLTKMFDFRSKKKSLLQSKKKLLKTTKKQDLKTANYKHYDVNIS